MIAVVVVASLMGASTLIRRRAAYLAEMEFYASNGPHIAVRAAWEEGMAAEGGEKAVWWSARAARHRW